MDELKEEELGKEDDEDELPEDVEKEELEDSSSGPDVDSEIEERLQDSSVLEKEEGRQERTKFKEIIRKLLEYQVTANNLNNFVRDVQSQRSIVMGIRNKEKRERDTAIAEAQKLLKRMSQEFPPHHPMFKVLDYYKLAMRSSGEDVMWGALQNAMLIKSLEKVYDFATEMSEQNMEIQKLQIKNDTLKTRIEGDGNKLEKFIAALEKNTTAAQEKMQARYEALETKLIKKYEEQADKLSELKANQVSLKQFTVLQEWAQSRINNLSLQKGLATSQIALEPTEKPSINNGLDFKNEPEPDENKGDEDA